MKILDRFYRWLHNRAIKDETKENDLSHSMFIPYKTIGEFRRKIKDEKHITWAKDFNNNTKIYIIETKEDKYGDAFEEWTLVGLYDDWNQRLHYNVKLLQYVEMTEENMKLVWRKI